MRKLLSVVAVTAVVLLLMLFGLGGAVALWDPVRAAGDFGLTINDPAGALYFRVYLSRNLVIVACATVFLLRRRWAALATLMTCCIALPVFDATVLWLTLAGQAHLAFHVGTAIALVLISALLWAHARTNASPVVVTGFLRFPADQLEAVRPHLRTLVETTRAWLTMWGRTRWSPA